MGRAGNFCAARSPSGHTASAAEKATAISACLKIIGGVPACTPARTRKRLYPVARGKRTDERTVLRQPGGSLSPHLSRLGGLHAPAGRGDGEAAAAARTG